MNCKQAEELLPLYAGRDLEVKRARLVTEHLQTCATCTRVADEYRQSVQWTGQFAPPVFSEDVYAGIRQRVLRQIQTEATAPSWAQPIARLFRPRLTWAIAGMLLVVVSMLAIYFLVNRKHEQQVAGSQPASIQPATKEEDKRVVLPPAVNTGATQQQAGIPQPRRKRSRGIVARRPSSLPQPTLFPPRTSASLDKTLRVEIQTQDPNIRIIWFVQPETKPANSNSKGT